MHTTTGIIQIHAIMNLVLAETNLPKMVFIEKVFPNADQFQIQHLKEVFKAKNYSIVSFLGSIDENHRKTVIKWIMDNYKGVSVQSIEKYYFTS